MATLETTDVGQRQGLGLRTVVVQVERRLLTVERNLEKGSRLRGKCIWLERVETEALGHPSRAVKWV